MAMNLSGLETDIYQNQKMPETPSYLDSATKAANLSGIGLQNQGRQQELEAGQRKAYLQKAAVFGDSLKALYKLPPEQRPQAYQQMRNDLMNAGVTDSSHLPEQFDDQHNLPMLGRYLNSEDHIKAQLDNDLTKAHANYFNAEAMKNRAEAGKKTNPAKLEFDNLPPENQEQIKELAKKSANKTSIKGQIDAALAALEDPGVSDEQKTIMGRNLAKVLNSTEGQDAVGNQEASRMVGLLDRFNLHRPGTPFGVQLGEFTKQVKNSSAVLGDAISRNKAQMETLYGRTPKVVTAQTDLVRDKVPDSSNEGVAVASEMPKIGEVRKGHVFRGGDPSKPASWSKVGKK